MPMTNDMARFWPISDRVKSLVALGLMLVTAAAWLLIASGAATGRQFWTNLGAVLSLVAMTWAVYPLLCAGVLVAIWIGRGAFRKVVTGPREDRAVLVDPLHVAPAKAAVPRLTDQEIF